jgi:glycosyltransferase involved in cell wall biosynthesis
LTRLPGRGRRHAVGRGGSTSTPATSLPGVSVALGTYNGERYLDRQLESLARQTVRPAELVACDDCSTDATMSILERFSKSAPFPVRIYRNDANQGFTPNFMGTAERCRERLIAFCDQDDVWTEAKIETCARFFALNPDVRLVLHTGQPVDEDLRPVGSPYPPISGTGIAPPLGADPWRMAPGFAVVADRALLDIADWRNRPASRDLNGQPMDFDEWLYFLAWAVGDVGFIDACLVLYRQHGANVFGAPLPAWRDRVEKLLHGDFATAAGRAHVARAYADCLEQASRKAPGEDVRGRLLAAARFWRSYELLARRREALYEADGFGSRLRSIGQLVAVRAYRGRQAGGMGRLALLRDLRELVRPGREDDGVAG